MVSFWNFQFLPKNNKIWQATNIERKKMSKLKTFIYNHLNIKVIYASIKTFNLEERTEVIQTYRKWKKIYILTPMLYIYLTVHGNKSYMRRSSKFFISNKEGILEKNMSVAPMSRRRKEPIIGYVPKNDKNSISLKLHTFRKIIICVM